jgi:hypothetical protein
MAITNANKIKQYRRIIDVYNEVKQSDIPDTFIVNRIFPRHFIFISYRQWMRIKDLKPSELQVAQLSLF